MSESDKLNKPLPEYIRKSVDIYLMTSFNMMVNELNKSKFRSIFTEIKLEDIKEKE